MTAIDEARASAEQADEDASEAEAVLDRLTSKLAWGDASVSAQSLAEQEQLARFAKLRAAGAHHVLKQARAAGTINDAKATVDEIARANLADPSSLIQAWTSAALAIRDLFGLATARERLIREHSEAMGAHQDGLATADAGVRVEDLGFQPGGALGESAGYRLPEQRVSVRSASAARLVAAALETAITEDGLGEFRSMAGSISGSDKLMLRGLVDLLPGLADAANGVQHGAHD